MPHKEKVIAYLDDVSGDAKAIGAVNTIQELGGELIGHNTDTDGFREFLLSDAGFDPVGKSALVLGGGGAARAVVRTLDDMKASSILVAARNPEQAERLAELAPGTRVASWADATDQVPEADLVVNATPAGDPLPGARFREGQLAVDLVYQPPSTVFIDRARAGGADAWGGLGMLVHQAVAAFRIWTGQEPPVETMSAAALHALRLAARE
jgi:shikimate dehydrogenase